MLIHLVPVGSVCASVRVSVCVSVFSPCQARDSSRTLSLAETKYILSCCCLPSYKPPLCEILQSLFGAGVSPGLLSVASSLITAQGSLCFIHSGCSTFLASCVYSRGKALPDCEDMQYNCGLCVIFYHATEVSTAGQYWGKERVGN